MAYLKYKGYNGSVEYNDEDNCLYGKVQGMSKDCITLEGESLAELRADFEAAIDDYIAGCEAEDIVPSGLRQSQPRHTEVSLSHNLSGCVRCTFG